MNRRSFLQNAVIASIAGQIPDLKSQTTAPNKRLTKKALSGLNAHYELSLDRVLRGQNPTYTPELLLADISASGGRRFTNFSGDLSGRYVGALSTVAQHRSLQLPGFDDLVATMISRQHPEGYFGASFNFEDPKDEDLALLWGNGRLLIGLLEYQQYRPTAAVLASATKLGNFLLQIGPLMNSDTMRNRFNADHYATSYICWTQTLESVIALYRATHDPAYLKLGREIAAHIEYRPGEHAHGFLASVRGIGDLYQLTQETQYLATMESIWHRIFNSENMLVTGGVPERWVPEKRRTEGCAIADWIRLSLTLWGITKKEPYIVAAENAIFNEFQLNHFAEGDFGHRVLNETGVDGSNSVRSWWCCTLHGLRCFPDIVQSAFRIDKESIFYDLPVSSSCEQRQLAISAVSTLEDDAKVRLHVDRTNANSAISVHIRKPIWAESIAITYNGSETKAEERDGYLIVKGQWKAGDEIEIHYVMRLRCEGKLTNNQFALIYGPWLLGADKLDSESYFNEETANNVLKMDGTHLPHESEQPSSNIFRVPTAHFSVEYQQAEYPMQPGTTVLRPVSEQAGLPSTDWQFLFTKNV
jgi:DUF1680 family protein